MTRTPPKHRSPYSEEPGDLGVTGCLAARGYDDGGYGGRGPGEGGALGEGGRDGEGEEGREGDERGERVREKGIEGKGWA